MMQTILKFFFLINFLFFSGQVSAKNQEENFLKLNEDGIKVYFYHHKNFNIGTFKAITYINASLASVLAVMFDNPSCPDWIHACVKSFVIKDISFNERYHYQIIDIPFPFKDRDFIFHSTLKQNPTTKAITIIVTSVPGYCHDKQSSQCNEVKQYNHVRVIKSIGSYKLEPCDKGIKMTWIQHTDPAGNLPNWLVNQFVTDTPYWTLKQLTKKVTEDKYKYSKLVYDNDGFAIALIIGKQKPVKKAKDFDQFPTF
ncbi:MAG: hypothetical protein KZQ83_04795 [gamma proteobacterium symbiont of Taylorina sp.]|nr:hypothetical protein [gamma proteobacterium symbiont of Taylorina sp.]